MAQAARRDGYRVIALDAFGDTDTQRAAHGWRSIAADGSSHVDAPHLLAQLVELAAGDVPGSAPPIGWVAGSDLETQPELLAAGAERLPLIGTAPTAVRRVRDPRLFFDTLGELGLPHPETRFAPPQEPAGWLRKLGRGCGGWHIRRAEGPGAANARPADEAMAPYFQREAPGQPMSALFVARAGGHRLVGINHLIVRALGRFPHVYRGAVGPVGLPAAAVESLSQAIDALVKAFALRGLCSLDFLWHDDRWSLLEINPRPSASMALYAHEPLMREHVEACRSEARGAEPSVELTSAARPITSRPGSAVRGIETVFSRQAFVLDATAAQALQRRGDCHDLPGPGARFEAGDPVCSVSAVGNNVEEVCERLATQRRTLRDAWASL